jgi:hypothetical protein
VTALEILERALGVGVVVDLGETPGTLTVDGPDDALSAIVQLLGEHKAAIVRHFTERDARWRRDGARSKVLFEAGASIGESFRQALEEEGEVKS